MRKWLDEPDPDWKKHEKRTAKLVRGRVTAASGATSRSKGDVRSKKYLVECKETSKKTMSVKLSWLLKIVKEAGEINKTPLLALRFSTEPGASSDWIMLRKIDFEDFIDG